MMPAETTHFLSISDKIKVLPLIHGSGNFAQVVRQKMLNESFDCLAVCIPPSFKESVEHGVRLFPQITLAALEEDVYPKPVYSYIPIDPCQPVIMGIRIALEENIPCAYIDREVSNFEPLQTTLPDAYALKKVSIEKFSAAILPAIPPPQQGSRQEKRIRWMSFQLHLLELQFNKILFLCSVLDWPWIRDSYNQRLPYEDHEIFTQTPGLYSVKENTLYFVLGELPYITYLYEKRRQELASDTYLSIDGVKEIIIEARNRWIKKYDLKYHSLTLQVLNIYMKYVRNLTLLERRMTPDIYTLVTAAKQIGGDGFAISLMETARAYPYQRDKNNLREVLMGIGQGELPESGVVRMKNRLSGPAISWRTLHLKPKPEIKKQKLWKFLWDPFGQCSWPIEDQKIESFNLHVREQAKALIGADLVRTEKFTTSVKDGIDIRDTLRHWYEGDIYVKEIPPARGNVEVIVLIFEINPDPEKYNWQQTWYAEHKAESTLCFYATPYPDNMIGPGIAESTYGGLFLLFPPRYIVNIWQDPRFDFARTLEERLLAAALFYSKERHVAVISPKHPPLSWRRLARQYKKSLVYIPLQRFSLQTIEKIRRFHILNGKHVRTYAAHFISDF